MDHKCENVVNLPFQNKQTVLKSLDSFELKKTFGSLIKIFNTTGPRES